MPLCDHFIYTAAKIGNTEGYQIIAKSAGITEEITSQLSKYLYPLGVKISDFIESRSLLSLSHNKISYSIVKNKGRGYDGRRGTLYNHTFVIDRTDFEKLNFDSRVFEKHFIQNDSLRGELKPIKIEPVSILPDFELLRKLDHKLLEELLHRLFRRKKIALMKTDEQNLLQNLLVILPSSLRLIQFSTLVVEPDRQYKFELIQIPEGIQSKVDKSFVIINPNELSSLTRRKSIYDENVEELAQIILNKDEKRLQQILKDYEKIPVQLSRVRRIKIEEIFNQEDFEYLVKKNNFGRLSSKIKKLYSSRKFNESSPKVMTSITKQIRKIIQKSLKNEKLSKKKSQKILEQIIPTVKILLDPMHSLHDYSEKPTSRTLRTKIHHEIIKLEEILEEYSVPETIAKPYMFNYLEYTRWQIELFIKSVQAGISIGLWSLGFAPKRKE